MLLFLGYHLYSIPIQIIEGPAKKKIIETITEIPMVSIKIP